jgi:hypothetical protein
MERSARTGTVPPDVRGPQRTVLLILASLAVVMMAFAGAADAKKKHKKKQKLGPIVTATATASGTTQGQTFTATATCPIGTNAIGGGFSMPPLPPSPNNAGLATASHKVGTNQWTASAQYLGSSGSIVLTTYVYCRKGAPVTTPVSTTTPLPEVTGPPVSATVSSASCPAGQVQLSGGFAIDSLFTGGSLETFLLSSHRADPLTWQASGLSLDSGHSLTSQADCATQPKAKKKKHKSSAVAAKKKKKKKVKKLVTPTEVTGEVTGNTAMIQTVTAAANCPSGTTPIAGGFDQPGAFSSTTLNFIFFITESQAVGASWHVSGFMEGSGSGTLRAYGYCTK